MSRLCIKCITATFMYLASSRPAHTDSKLLSKLTDKVTKFFSITNLSNSSNTFSLFQFWMHKQLLFTAETVIYIFLNDHQF